MRRAFGDERVLVEKYVLKPRHIEIQVFGDTREAKATPMASVPRSVIASASNLLMAYCGMAVGRVFDIHRCSRTWRRVTAAALRKSCFQQPNVVVLSRTEKIERLPQNTDIFEFALSDDDMAAIGTLKSPGSRIVNPSHLAPARD